MNSDNVGAVDIRNGSTFSYVMHNPKICIELLEHLLPDCKFDKVNHYKVDSEKSDSKKSALLVFNPQQELLVETQKTLAESFGKRGVRTRREAGCLSRQRKNRVQH